MAGSEPTATPKKRGTRKSSRRTTAPRAAARARTVGTISVDRISEGRARLTVDVPQERVSELVEALLK